MHGRRRTLLQFLTAIHLDSSHQYQAVALAITAYCCLHIQHPWLGAPRAGCCWPLLDVTRHSPHLALPCHLCVNSSCALVC
jgi:hypothetical protein